MTNFYLELIGVVNEAFKASFDEHANSPTAEVDGEDRIRSYVCIEVEEAIRVKLKEKYQKAARKRDKEINKAVKELEKRM